MSIAVAVAVVPAGLRPRWHMLPRLAWTAASAFTPTRVPGLRHVLVTAGATLFYLPVIGAAHTLSHLAGPNAQALVVTTVEGSRFHQVLQALATTVAYIVVTLLAFTAVTTLGVVLVLAGVAPTRAVWVVSWLAYAVLALAVVAVGLTAPDAARACSRQNRAKRELPPGAPYLMLTMLAAWPQRQGHATRLAEQLIPALVDLDVPVVVIARDPALAQVYARWGLTPQPNDPQILMYRPTSS